MTGVTAREARPQFHCTESRLRIAKILRRSPKLWAWQVAEQLEPELKNRLDWVRKTMRDLWSGFYVPRAQVNLYWNRKYRAWAVRVRQTTGRPQAIR